MLSDSEGIVYWVGKYLFRSGHLASLFKDYEDNNKNNALMITTAVVSSRVESRTRITIIGTNEYSLAQQYTFEW
jgi:hypothetical protein